VTIRTFPRGRLLHTAQLPASPVVAVWRPDGRQIAVGGLDGSVALIDPHTGDVRRVPSTGTNSVAFVAYRPDGRELWVTDLNRNNAVITGLDGARPTASRTTRLDGANQVVFTADGRSLVALRGDQVQVYDAATLIPRAAPIAAPAAGYSYAPWC
jgi:DNA-binding beta-propeller fold protein YncE